MDTVVRCLNLFKNYPGKPPVQAVRGLSLEVFRGECVGLLGPNGAGKTTTIEILEGLMPPTQGSVELLGMSWGKQSRALRQRIGISLQETRLAEKLTVFETICLFRSFYKAGCQPEDLLRRVSLEEKRNAYVEKLSGGQKQRLAVATALVGTPDILFLDEPTTGLDPGSRRQIWQLIFDFLKQGTVILTTHYMEEAERLCNRVAIVSDGQIIAMDTPNNLIQQLEGNQIVEFTVTSENSQRGSLDRLKDQLSNNPLIRSVRADNSRFLITVSELAMALPQLLGTLAELELKFATLRTRNASLEDVFIKLTGRHLVENGVANHEAPEVTGGHHGSQ